MAEEYALRIPAKKEGLVPIQAFVCYLLDQAGCTGVARTQLRTAVEEIYVNQTLYAYPEGEGWVEIRGNAENGEAAFTLIDGGTPFDPLKVQDPDILLSGEERPIGGLGIFMVRTLVDELAYEYRDGCNRLTMRKRLRDEQ